MDSIVLYLSPSIKIINGLRSYCLLNYNSGEFVLINKDAVTILESFKFGESLDNVILNFYKDKVDILSFIKDCISNKILLIDKPIYNTDSCNFTINSKLSLTLEITHYCNLKCQHCYNESEKSYKNEYLPFLHISRIFKELKLLYQSLTQLTITGGEPFSYTKLNELIKIALDSGFQRIRINTNGTIFPTNQGLIDTLKVNQEKISLQISLLGTNSETHDFLTSIAGSFSRTLSNIPKFLTIIPQTKLSFLHSKVSKNLQKEAEKISSRFGVPFTINKIIRFGRAVENSKNIQTKYTLENSLNCDEKYSNSTYGQLRKDQTFTLPQKFPPELPCGKETLNIFWNGDVYPCTLLRGVKIGNIKKESIKDIIGSRKLYQFRKEIDVDNKETCMDCEIRYFCSFKCPALSLSQGKSLHDKSPQCSYY